MAMNRRTTLGTLAAAVAMAMTSPAWAQSTVIKISHQFPGGTIDKGDFRDRLVRTFAAEVEKRTKGSLKFEIYPGASLMKINAQFSAIRKGALDMTLLPLSYAGGEVPETNIGLMPGLVTSYDQGYAWKNAPVGRELTKVLADKGVVVVTWIWQAGGMATRGKPIVDPDDAKGMKIRGGSREMDLMLKEAGAAVVTQPSNEIYAGMQTGAMDAALTSSTSLISFRTEEVSKSLTSGRGKSYWFMLEPLLMSKASFDRLTKEQQAAVMAVGAEMEAFALKGAKADDDQVVAVFAKAGAKTIDMTEATVKKWQDIARRTAWKDFADKSASTARLLQLAEQVK